MSPIETAADKLSALTWRVLKRDRTAAADDPAMIRHLHDIAALITITRDSQSLFVETVQSSFEEDQNTVKRATGEPLSSSVKAAIGCLESDVEYRNEYRRFLDAMSYASDDEAIDFDTAMVALEEVGAWFE